MSMSVRPGNASFPIAVTSGAVTVDATHAEGQTLTLTGDAAITFTGFLAGRLMTVRMFVTQGAHAITWPASVHWLRGTPPPALTSSSEVTFTSLDGGVTILADYAGHTAPDVQDFIASGTWTKPAGATRVMAELISGGGGGNNNNGGGGGGGYVRNVFDASDLGATEAVTVGAGGAGGAFTDGGASSFAGLTVPGGQGGQVNSEGGDGALGGAGAANVSGTPGGPSMYGGGGGSSTSAKGGDSGYGGGGGGYSAGGIGGASHDPNALLGGNGGASTFAGTAPGGGGGAGGKPGARGQVRITTYFD